jgi:hypothetical protein
VRKVPDFASPVGGKPSLICLVIDGTMNPELVDACEINDKVFDYAPLLSDEAKESGWTRNPPGAFGGLGSDGHYRNVDFYTKSIQKSFLVFLEKKASNTRHRSFSRFTSIDGPERGLIEYYNVAKNGIERIKVPTSKSECSDMKFVLDTSRLLLAYGLFHAKQFVPLKESDDANSNRECLDWYIVSILLLYIWNYITH